MDNDCKWVAKDNEFLQIRFTCNPLRYLRVAIDLGIARPKSPRIPPALQFDTGVPFPVACSRLYPDRDVDIYALTILPFDNERKAVVSAGDSAAHVIDLSTTLVTVSVPGKETMQISTPLKEETSSTGGLFTRVVKTSASRHGPARRSLFEHKGAVLAVDCALPDKKPDEPVVLTGSVAELGRVWFPSSLEQFALLRGHRAPVYGVALSYSVDIAVTASGDSTVRVWLLEDINKRALLTSSKSNKHGNLRKTFSNRKNKEDSLDEQTGGARTLAILRGHVGEVFTVEVLDDRRSGGVLRAVSGGEDRVVNIWDLETKSILRSLQGHEKKIYAVAVPRTTEKELCGRVILSSSGDKTCRIWDSQSANPLTGILENHDDEVWGCCIGCHGRYALTCTVNGSAYVWDLRRQSTPLSVFHSKEPLRCCASSPSNRTFHTADIKGNIYHIYVGGQSPHSTDIDSAEPPGSFGYELRGRSFRDKAILRNSQSVSHNMMYMEHVDGSIKYSSKETQQTNKQLVNEFGVSDNDTCENDSQRPSSSCTQSGSNEEVRESISNTKGDLELGRDSFPLKQLETKQEKLQGDDIHCNRPLQKTAMEKTANNCQIL